MGIGDRNRGGASKRTHPRVDISTLARILKEAETRRREQVFLEEKVRREVAAAEEVTRAWEAASKVKNTLEGDGVLSVSVHTASKAAKVFIVHGRDDGTKQTVARFLEKLGFDAVILHERRNKGRTIITKFREEAAEASFAIVLMTPNDHGGINGSQDLKSRARQNVIFELGFFIGELGPERVVALVKGTIERPSDFDGVAYVDLDDIGAWKMALAGELQAAGLHFDLKAVIG